MTEQSALAFAERYKSDETLRDSLAAAPDAEARQTIAREAGYEFSPEDAPVLESAFGLDQLSDEDLEQVAGTLHDISQGTMTMGCIHA